MKTHCLISLVILTACFSCFTFADEVHLKDGRVVEGSVISESQQSIVVRRQLPGNIIKEEVIDRSQIVTVSKDSPDIQEFRGLPASTVGGVNSLTLAQYNQVISNAFLAFMAKHPSSPKLSEVQRRLEETQKDRDRVAGGEVKISGRWYSAKQRSRRAFEDESSKLAQAVIASTQNGNYTQIIQAWNEYRQNGFGGLSTPTVVVAVRDALSKCKVSLERQQESLKSQRSKLNLQKGEAERTVLLKPHAVETSRFTQSKEQSHWSSSTQPLKNPTKYGYTEQEERAMQSAREFLQKYLDLVHQTDQEVSAGEVTIREVAEHVQKIKEFPDEKMKQSVTASLNAEALLDSGKVPEASVDVRRAIDLWPDNRFAMTLNKELGSPLRPSGQFDSSLASEKTSPLSGQASVLDTYKAELERLAAGFQARGELEPTLAVRNELKRVSLANSLSQRDAVQAPSELKVLQQQYLTKLQDHTMVTVASLEEQKRKLTMEGKLEEAIQVNERISRLRGASAKIDTVVANSDTAAVINDTLMKYAWKTPFGGVVKQGDSEVLFNGPGTMDCSGAIAVCDANLGDSYTLTGQVQLQGCAGIVLAYSAQDHTYVSLYSGGGSAEYWKNTGPTRTSLGPPGLALPHNVLTPFRIKKAGKQATVQFGTSSVELHLPSDRVGNQFGFIVYFGRSSVLIKNLAIE